MPRPKPGSRASRSSRAAPGRASPRRRGLGAGGADARGEDREARALRCGIEVAALRAEPDASAEQVTQVLRGEELQVEEHRGGWVLVRTAYDYPGWIREGELVVGSPL